jgi:alkanesulfonate monooxygenase SsuD/methylene tetrahydromethanopterin reductase-like flavin-dependent oxidoreductase (luciferase family)
MANQDTTLDVWSMTAAALARECHRIASGSPEAVEERLRAEAKQLAAELEEALQMPQEEPEDAARRAGRLAALKKRAIEIYVKVHPNA